MCLGVPMRIVESDGYTARCEARGVERSVSLFLLQHEAVAPGDHVMVHLEQAVRRMTAEEAAETWELLDQMLAAEDSGQRNG
jgi:hydrogenase expression/formation protein HypC